MAKGRTPDRWYKGKSASEWYKIAQKAINDMKRMNKTAEWGQKVMEEADQWQPEIVTEAPMKTTARKTKKTKK